MENEYIRLAPIARSDRGFRKYMLEVLSCAWNFYFIRESAEIIVRGGKSCFPARQKKVEAGVIEGEGANTRSSVER